MILDFAGALKQVLLVSGHLIHSPLPVNMLCGIRTVPSSKLFSMAYTLTVHLSQAAAVQVFSQCLGGLLTGCRIAILGVKL